MSELKKIAVIGLGYVGLPLAIHLARHYPVTGLDIDTNRVSELLSGQDRTNEIDDSVLKSSSLEITDQVTAIENSDIYIVTVPTPVDVNKQPDLTAVRGASRLVGGVLKKGAIVVYESTVYPGVTEDVAGPELEAASGLICGADFFLGYSPERINPGDKQHTVDKITKVVAGQNDQVTAVLSEVYGRLTSGGIFVARDIRTAEAAKVIENAQRDINIAFINEVATIFQKMGLSVYDVLEAAGTKWNFLNFSPGLVGGHCIGVDPFYLAHSATANGHHPEIILAGRRINDGMGGYVAECIARELTQLGKGAGAKILVLGLTFKENVPDLRNSRVIDIIQALQGRGFSVKVHDAYADRDEAETLFGISLRPSLEDASGYDCLVGAVPHQAYAEFDPESFATLLTADGLVADVKGMWRSLKLPENFARWQL
ncbi:MAG: UDP-N-acetyl-D-galactosamine dehydrogenase [Rhodospirillaceae bacterium]|nr:UDP-N-acetyl-D-galactosamine dehydrogenase [Rhodospirillaceae bacterium]|tara:strand:+ start:23739 stop:25022 length:1284 start_codon:yes stop_codon:yes gene_type:complete